MDSHQKSLLESLRFQVINLSLKYIYIVNTNIMTIVFRTNKYFEYPADR